MKKNEIQNVAMNCDAEAFREQLFSAMGRAEQRRLKELQSSSAKRLTLAETLHMAVVGRADGLCGMPREAENGVWTSPFLQREIDAQQEHQKRIWGETQILLEPYHMRTESLLTVIAVQEQELAEKTKELDGTGESGSPQRKRGEEKLTDGQVQARRKRELDRLKSKVLAEIRNLKNELKSYYEELSLLHRYIEESESTAKLISERVMDHSRQRIDMYWRAAFKVLSNNANMPVLPILPDEVVAEKSYLERHEALSRSVTLSLERYRRQAGWTSKMTSGHADNEEVA